MMAWVRKRVKKWKRETMEGKWWWWGKNCHKSVDSSEKKFSAHFSNLFHAFCQAHLLIDFRETFYGWFFLFFQKESDEKRHGTMKSDEWTLRTVIQHQQIAIVSLERKNSIVLSGKRAGCDWNIFTLTHSRVFNFLLDIAGL